MSIQETLSETVDRQFVLCNIVDDGLWDAFVKSHPAGSPFHLSGWQKLVHETFGHEPHHIIVRTSPDGPIIGLLPLFLVRSRIFGRMLVSTPQAAYGGVLANSDAVADLIYRRARELAKDLEVEFLELRSFRNAISDKSLLQKDLYVTFRQEIIDVDTNMQLIPRKTRAEIREGIKHGLEFQVDGIDVDGFFDIYSRSVHQLGTPVFPKQLFANGQRIFGSECKICSVHWQGKLVAAVWTLFYKDEVVPYFGGSIREYNRLAVNNFMYWMLLKYGCENGYKTYDFGRSKVGTGSFDFKKRWGMTMTSLPYQYALVRKRSMPDTSPLNPKFKLSIDLWRRLPLPVTRLVGPYVSKHLI